MRIKVFYSHDTRVNRHITAQKNEMKGLASKFHSWS